MTYAEFKKLKIDTAGIGWYRDSNPMPYFCTPRGARIIGHAGVDGIHYCTVRTLGETVFAVNPTALPGKYVLPIARTFEDLLRLLLACCDMNVIEQAHMWDEEQLEESIEAVRCSEHFDGGALLAIREKCGLAPMENPYAYLYSLQRSFDSGSIPFTKEYYDMMAELAAPDAEWQPPSVWKVTVDGDFFPERGKGGREIPLNTTFRWGREVWHVPAAYLCTGGVVADFFAEADPEQLLAFRRVSAPLSDRGHLTREEEEQLRRQNPLSLHFRPKLTVNGMELPNKSGRGEVWIPESCRDPGEKENAQARWIVSHYGLDLSRLWIIRRCTFPNGTKIRDIRTLSLTMVRASELFAGMHFTSPEAGDCFPFTHPVTGTAHTLTVLAYTPQKIDTSRFSDDGMEYPPYCIAMQYAVTPELPPDTVAVRDCADGDTPRRKKNAPAGGPDFVSVMPVIRASDGPIAVMAASAGTAEARSVCSALYFEPPERVEWRMVFSVKTADDMETELI